MRDALEAYLRKGPPVDARRVAALLDDHFASERARIRGLIDEQLKSSDATQPMIDLAARASVTPPSSVISAARATRGRRLSPALAAAGASLVLGAVAFGVAGRRGRNVAAVPSVRVAAPSSSEALPVAASGVAPPADARDVASATVAIRTVPPTATLAFDGKRVGNPYHATLAKDGRTHTLQVAAPGFLPELRALVIDRDRDEVITLLRAPAVAPTATNPTKRPQRTIDDQDPYQ
jgi:hypothetical protein